MHAVSLSLPGLLLIQPTIHHDTRGFFLETYSQGPYQEVGVDCKFVQDNHSRSKYGVLRGMHYQSQPGQAKLVRVAVGRIFDVAVDIRPNSATFGKWEGVYLDADMHQQLFVPIGFAHGFCVISDVAEVLYKVSSPYHASTERSFRFDDPDVGIKWPILKPDVSQRDQDAPYLKDLQT